VGEIHKVETNEVFFLFHILVVCFFGGDNLFSRLLLSIAVHVWQARFPPASRFALIPVAHARGAAHEAVGTLVSVRLGRAAEAATRAVIIGRGLGPVRHGAVLALVIAVGAEGKVGDDGCLVGGVLLGHVLHEHRVAGVERGEVVEVAGELFLVGFLAGLAMRVLLDAEDEGVDGDEDREHASQHSLNDDEYHAGDGLGRLRHAELLNEDQNADDGEHADGLDDAVDPVTALQAERTSPQEKAEHQGFDDELATSLDETVAVGTGNHATACEHV
jgi:hypothetical protein